MKVVAIIQTRMGSSRLPGEALKVVNGKTMLETMVYRLKKAKMVDQIVIATTVKPTDDIVVEEAKKLGLEWYRGSEDDVLSRYCYTVAAFEADIVIRLSSDCPFIMPEIVDEMVTEYLEHPHDLYSFIYPAGSAIEVMSAQKLYWLYFITTEKSDREHVTYYFIRQPELFDVVEKDRVEERFYSKRMFSFTLDTQEDFDLIQTVIDRIGIDFTYDELIRFLEQNPDVANMNPNSIHKNVL
jgi:spore coat polysaccharide biosynthesis protein SpsF